MLYRGHSCLFLLLEAKWSTSHLAIRHTTKLSAMTLKRMLLVTEMIWLHWTSLHIALLAVHSLFLRSLITVLGCEERWPTMWARILVVHKLCIWRWIEVIMIYALTTISGMRTFPWDILLITQWSSCSTHHVLHPISFLVATSIITWGAYHTVCCSFPLSHGHLTYCLCWTTIWRLSMDKILSRILKYWPTSIISTATTIFPFFTQLLCPLQLCLFLCSPFCCVTAAFLA